MPIDDLRSYCEAIRTAVADPDHAGELSLYPALHDLLSRILPRLSEREDVTIIQQASTGVGAPDFKVSMRQRPPLGFVEAKAPDNDLRHRTGHDKEQFEKYSDLPNWIYCNFWQFRLYHRGELVARATLVPRGALDPSTNLNQELRQHDSTAGLDLLQQFVLTDPPLMENAPDVAGWLASSARLVRGAVQEALLLPPEDIAPLIDVRDEFREVLFAQMEDEDEYDEAFSDAYAQTLAYGLLIARIQSGELLSLANAHQLIDESHHPLLRATVRLLAEDEILRLVGWSLEVLTDVVNAIDPSLLREGDDRDPILYFYEDFLAAYDPELRRKRGVYYTPPSVVQFQVKAIHQLLKDKFNLSGGLLNERVFVLDPAAGTGTYLIACLQEAAAEAERQLGPGAVNSAVQEMLPRLFGFELLVGPYTVAHYRLQAAAIALGSPPDGRLQIYLTDTLSPSHQATGYTPKFAYLSAPLTQEREAADRVKSQKPILVVLGNPPYDRTTASRNEWIYRTLLDDFRQPVREAGLGVHLKSLSDPYVYFYRWALWRLFEADGAVGTGIVSFITNRSWLRGEAFGGLREATRRLFDDAWIFDLHGDSRAPLPAGVDEDGNVFDIQTGVAISILIRSEEREGDATIRYAEKLGTRAAKEAVLEAGFSSLDWEDVPGTGIDPILPSLSEEFERWPSLKEIFRFQKSGVKSERDNLVIDVERSHLLERLRSFLALPLNDQVEPFHESGGRTVAKIRRRAVVEDLVCRVTYRFLDRRWLYNDTDFVSRPGPEMQTAWGTDNVGLYAMGSHTGYGQAAVMVGELPDYHAFRGSYGGYVFPLFDRRSGTSEPNLRAELTNTLTNAFGDSIEPEEIFHFIYAILACDQYSLRFSNELQQSFPRVPIPENLDLFRQGVALGARLTSLHTFREARPEADQAQIYGELGPIGPPSFDDGRLAVTEGGHVEPISDEVWNFSISGYRVLRRWLEARNGHELNLDLVRELLLVIYIIEQTISLQPELDQLLDDVLAGRVFSSEDLSLRASAQ